MLDFIFNGNETLSIIKSIIISVGVIMIIMLLLKILRDTGTFTPFFKAMGKVLTVVLAGCLILSGVYSYVYLTAYYKDDGGIYGKLNSVVYNSIEEIKSDDNQTITYNFDNLIFKADDDGVYSIVFIQNYKDEDYRTRFQQGTLYSIFVTNNGEKYECENVTYDTEWIHSNYSYIFYGTYDEAEVLATDTLEFDFCFYENYSYLKITSSADYTTIRLWNAYFQKYNFQVTIEVVDDVYEPDDVIIIDGFVKVNYIISEYGLYSRAMYSVSSTKWTPDTNFKYGDYYVVGWKNKAGEPVTSIDLSTSANITLYAEIIDLNEMIEINFYTQDGSSVIATKYYQYGDEIDFEVTNAQAGIPNVLGLQYTFRGWVSSPTDPIEERLVSAYPFNNTTTATSSTNLYPLFSVKSVAILM